jgi:hypothetical protein
MTKEEKQKVIELWEQGLSGQAIGNIFGVTRCSILGLINRLRRNGHVFERPFERDRSKRENVVKATIVPKIKKEKKQAIKKPKLKKEIVKKKPEPEPIVEIFENVDLMGLKINSCRYPVSADDVIPIMFCGRPQERGSYCKEHGAICYYPSKYQTTRLPD